MRICAVIYGLYLKEKSTIKHLVIWHTGVHFHTKRSSYRVIFSVIESLESYFLKTSENILQVEQHYFNLFYFLSKVLSFLSPVKSTCRVLSQENKLISILFPQHVLKNNVSLI